MTITDSNSFGLLFKEFRLQANILTLKSFANLLADYGFVYEESLFSHWQSNRKIPINRTLLLTILKIFKSKNQKLTFVACNEFLSAAGQGYVTKEELSFLQFPPLSSFRFLVPPQLTYFTGREKELHEIYTALKDQKIVQLYGQAGIGKTMLAVEFAHTFAQLYPDGVYWYRIDTSGVASILNHLATASNENIQEVRDVSLKRSIVNNLFKDKKALIILDNVEEKDIKYLYRLLLSGEDLRYIITTKCAFLPIDTLPYMVKLESFNKGDVEKFFKRTNSHIPLGKFLTHCAEYGNLPLVVASLAKRIVFLEKQNINYTIEDIVKDTHNLFVYEDKELYCFFDKQRKILSKYDHEIWVITALFNGADFSEDAICFVAGLPSYETKQILGKLFQLSLIEKSVDNRWRIHPFIKKYLQPFINADSYKKLSGYYSHIFKREDNGYKTIYPKIDGEFDNISALMHYCLEQKLIVQANTLWDFFSIYLWDRGYWYLFQELGEAIYTLAKESKREDIEAIIAIRDLSWLYIWNGNILQAYKVLKNKTIENNLHKNHFLLALRDQRLGFVYGQHRLVEKANTHLEKALSVFRLTKDVKDQARTLMYIGNTYERIGNYEKALPNYLQALDLASNFRYLETQAIVTYYIGEVYKKQNKFDEAKGYFNKAFEIDIKLNRKAGWGWKKHSLSEIAYAEGNYKLGKRLHTEAHAAFYQVGVSPQHLQCMKLP